MENYNMIVEAFPQNSIPYIKVEAIIHGMPVELLCST